MTAFTTEDTKGRKDSYDLSSCSFVLFVVRCF